MTEAEITKLGKKALHQIIKKVESVAATNGYEEGLFFWASILSFSFKGLVQASREVESDPPMPIIVHMILKELVEFSNPEIKH